MLIISQLFFLLPPALVAQTYPVQANLNISSPCPNTLDGFFPMGNSQVNLSVFLSDITQPEVQIRFRITIEGPGIVLQTPQTLMLQPTSIQGGIPRIYGNELEPYFRKENLSISGNASNHFYQMSTLPEGFYTFKIQIVEHRRNIQISNDAVTVTWLIQNEPPLLISPQNNQNIEVWGTQFVYIAWIPQHISSPGSGSNINYKLSLWELPNNFDPNIVVNSLQPIETFETNYTSMVWGPERATLIPGKFYVVAVRAIDPLNQVTFKNNGLSVPHIFKYGSSCAIPYNVNHSNVTEKTADIQWQVADNTYKFRVEFKPIEDQNGDWRSFEATETSTTLRNLVPKTKYSYRITSICGSYFSEPSFTGEFTTLEMQSVNNECTPIVSTPNPGNQPLLSTLSPNLLIMAAGFPVIVNSFNQVAPFTFNGEGFITLPLFNFNLRAKLNGIKVNTALHLVGGTVEALQGDSITFFNNDTNDPAGPGTVDFTNPNDTVYIDAGIDSVYMNPDSTWTVVTTDGETVVVNPADDGTLVVDPDGNGVVIIDDNVYTVNTGNDQGNEGDAEEEIVPTSICENRVNFSPGGSMHKYGFDPYKESMPPGTYLTIDIGSETLHLPWKSVATEGSDRLFATPETNPAPTFSYRNGQPIAASAGESGYQLWTGTPSTGEENLLALCDENSVAGGVRVKAYDLVRHKVAVVPVGNSQPNFTAAELQNALNQIYAQAVIEWQVTIEQPISAANLPILADGLEVPETDYSPEMRSIKWAYLAQRTPAPGTVYLFIIPNFTNSPEMKGYMPLKSSYGFLTPTSSTRDAAHELGHGVFNLRHTFSDDNIVTLPKGSTQNLMDNTTGTELFKYQWDNIHDPEGGWFVFEDSEEGAAQNFIENYTIYVGDSIMTNKRIFINTNKTEKIYVKYLPDASDTGTFINAKLVYRPIWNESDISWPVTTWNNIKVNEKQSFELDSLPEGRYNVLLKNLDNKVDTIIFYLRPIKYDFACSVCGRDLTITKEKLDLIYPNGESITTTLADYFNTALKTAGFSTCKSHAHFFAQSYVETKGFKELEENPNYRYEGVLELHNQKDDTKLFFNQTFFNNNVHLDYFHFKVYKNLEDSTGNYLGQNYKKFKWKSSATDTVIVPTGGDAAYKFTKGKGTFDKINFTKSEKIIRNKQLLSIIYANKFENGAPSTEEGYKYRGQGAMHLTWKENYRRVIPFAKELFKEDFDWINHPEYLVNKEKDAVYSAVAYFYFRLNKDINKINDWNVEKVSSNVNGGYNGLPQRKEQYNRLSTLVFYLSECKK